MSPPHQPSPWNLTIANHNINLLNITLAEWDPVKLKTLRNQITLNDQKSFTNYYKNILKNEKYSPATCSAEYFARIIRLDLILFQIRMRLNNNIYFMLSKTITIKELEHAFCRLALSAVSQKFLCR